VGILITFQGDILGTIDTDKDGAFTYTGDKETMAAIVEEFQAKHEEPAALMKRLPKILRGTMSAIAYEGDTPPKMVVTQGIGLGKPKE